MRQPRKFRGNMVSPDGGTTWQAMSHGGDSAHMGASVTSRELAGWTPVAGSADSDLLPDLSTLVSRARDLDRNHGIASGVRQTKLDNVVGVGFRLSSTPDYRALGRDKQWAEEWSAQVESLVWRPWAETTECDIARVHNFNGLTRQVYSASLLNGESLALVLWAPDARGRNATRLQVLEADRLSTPIGRIDGQYMRGGVEIDDFGRPLAYWIRKAHPGDALLGVLPAVVEWERVPAETPWGRKRVIHVHDQERTGQSRGKPDLTAVLTQFKMLDHYQRTEIQAAVVNAMIAAFVETPLQSAEIAQMFDGDTDQYLKAKQEFRVQLKGGAVVPLYPGDKLAPFAPARPSSAYGPFTENVLRHIAAGLNIPYELLLKDFSKTNYSSARAALMESWRHFMGRRRWLTERWATPVFELRLEEAVNAGLVEAPGFYDNRYAYSRCKWIGPGRGWIDPVKEAQAAALRMESYISTLEDECAEQGQDWEEVLEQRASEQARMRELGLPLPAPKSGQTPPPESEEERPEMEPAGGVR